MTGYTPELKDNVQKITLYNILSIWAQFKILQHLEKWDHIIAFKTKHQKKYLMVTISIDFNKKKRERFQAVVKYLSETVTTSMLYLSDPSQSPILHLGCKAFKLNLQEYEGV
ncbi:hypothetical protein GLOIN_2v1787148 [Rhizophagus irregularis DAOM 181602=DAOM 197198]|nr:hypothetical protein GLOIN_2v1787148 [Rhizophagus irregularis DAOM 181602=DAOM 197198]